MRWRPFKNFSQRLWRPSPAPFITLKRPQKAVCDTFALHWVLLVVEASPKTLSSLQPPLPPHLSHCITLLLLEALSIATPGPLSHTAQPSWWKYLTVRMRRLKRWTTWPRSSRIGRVTQSGARKRREKALAKNSVRRVRRLQRLGICSPLRKQTSFKNTFWTKSWKPWRVQFWSPIFLPHLLSGAF